MRPDKRKAGDLRSVVLKAGSNPYAEGSCLVRFGKTEVLCTVSVEEGVPGFLKNSGKGWVTAEYSMLPRSCRSRIPRESAKGKIGGRTHEIQRLIGRSLRAVTDLTKLGERTFMIDCDVLVGDAGTRCASITGSWVALSIALKKLMKDGAITDWPLKDQVAAVSVAVVGGRAVLDPNYDEDSKAEVDMNVVMTGKGRFVEVQGTAEGEPFGDADLKALLGLAKSGIRKLLTAQRRAAK